MPGNIKGLLGSCLVIPCNFGYNQYPPSRPDRVVWYQYHNHKYPLVCDSWYEDHVIDAFRRKTRIVTQYGKCSLQIYPVTWSHHSQNIYPWVDPENVGKSTYRFFDKTVRIEVVGKLLHGLEEMPFKMKHIPCYRYFFSFLMHRQGRQAEHRDIWRQEGWTVGDSPLLCLSHLSCGTTYSESQHPPKKLQSFS